MQQKQLIAIAGMLTIAFLILQPAAAVRWESGSRILRAGFTHTGDAKIAIHHWARGLRHWIDFANGRTGTPFKGT